jgi:hypothetical protein
MASIVEVLVDGSRSAILSLCCVWMQLCLKAVYHSCALLLAKASGRQVLPGADTPFRD